MHAVKLPMVPAAFFGIVLGLAGLANSWKAAASLWGISSVVGESLMFIAAMVWAIVGSLYAAKWVVNRPAAIAEANNPVQCCFIGLGGVSTMLIGLGFTAYSWTLALVIIVAGIVATLAFALWRTGWLWHGGRDSTTTTAVLYLPTVGGSFVAALVAGSTGYPEVGQMIFGVGFFSWLAIESVLLNRLLNAPELAPPLRPTLGIQLAPPAVGCVAYLSVTSGPPDVLSHAMIGYGIFLTVLLLRMLPWIMVQPFAASYWGATFGITALASASIRMAARGDALAGHIAPFAFVFANAVVGVIAVSSVYLLFAGRLIPSSAPDSSRVPAPGGVSAAIVRLKPNPSETST